MKKEEKYVKMKATIRRKDSLIGGFLIELPYIKGKLYHLPGIYKVLFVPLMVWFSKKPRTHLFYLSSVPYPFLFWILSFSLLFGNWFFFSRYKSPWSSEICQAEKECRLVLLLPFFSLFPFSFRQILVLFLSWFSFCLSELQYLSERKVPVNICSRFSFGPQILFKNRRSK